METRSGAVGGQAISSDLVPTLMAVVGGLVVVLDTHGLVVEVNAEACRILGLTREEVLGADWVARFVPERVRSSVEQVRSHLLAGAAASAEHFENPIQTATGEERTVLWHNAVLRDAAGTVTKVVASGVDITDRVRLEREQRDALARAAASEQRYRTIFETAATPIARLDQHGTILDCNRAAEVVFGHPAEALEGRPATVLIHPDDRLRLRGDLRDISTLGVYHHRAYRALRADGAELVIEVDAAVVPLDGSGAYEIVCHAADVTAQARGLGLERLSARLLRAAHQHDTLPGLCQAFCGEIQAATGLPAVSVRRLQPDGTLESVANLGFPAAFHEHGNTLRLGSRCGCALVLAGLAIPEAGPYTAGGSFVIRDTSQMGGDDAEPWFAACRQSCSVAGFRSLATIPVRQGEAVLGVVQVAGHSPNAVPSDMLAMLEDAALQLGQAMRRILAEQRLHRQLAFQRELLEAVPIPVCHLDREGRVADANRSWRRTVGELTDASGGRVARHLPLAEDDATLAVRPVPQGRQIELRNAAGQIRRVELHRAHFRGLDQGDGGSILALVDVLANRSAVELMGMPAEGPPPAGLPMEALPIDARCLDAALLPGDLHSSGRCVTDLRFQDPLGRPGVLDVRLLPIEAAGWEGSTLLVAQDATQRRSLEHRLVQARKMESIGQLAAGIAHEINTPTQYVGDNLQFLADSFHEMQPSLVALRDAEFPLGDTLQPGSPHAIARDTRERLDLDFLLEEIPLSLEQAQEGVGRIGAIVRAMREFAHGQGAEKVVTDVNRCIQSTATVARNEWKYVADLVLDLDPELPMIPTMAAELNQVLLNLLTNAAQAIGESHPDTKGTITVRSERWEQGVRVSVTDNGCGIPYELQPRVFEPFFTTKPVGRGTGQGLAISRAVMTEKLGGEIDFDSTPGVGTTFRVTLPGRA